MNNINICPHCMEKHETVVHEVDKTFGFKGECIDCKARYFYCINTDEYYENEELRAFNSLSLLNAYRVKHGLLTLKEIIHIRHKYDISQSDLAIVLGWGEKTITRYEIHQVQDSAHDSILRKIDSDPLWFISLLKGAKDKLSASAYEKYYQKALEIFEMEKDRYLSSAILSSYSSFNSPSKFNGNTKLNLDKVTDVIRYFSNSVEVKYLNKVKLMNYLFLSDSLAYSLNGKSITGMVYLKSGVGAIALDIDLILSLKGIPCIKIETFNGTVITFPPDNINEYPNLNDDDIKILNQTISNYEEKDMAEIAILVRSFGNDGDTYLSFVKE